MDATIRQLQDTMTVVAGIQARQAEVLKGQSQWLDTLQQQSERHAAFIARHEQLMAEMEGKLNALINIVDQMGRRGPNGHAE